MPEDLGQGPAVAVDQPPLAIAVVHRERAALGQVRSCLGDRLAREQVALQPQRAVARHQREGVRQREQHEVVSGRGALQEGAPVVDHQMDARVLVGVIRMPRPADRGDAGVDLDRVHGLGAAC